MMRRINILLLGMLFVAAMPLHAQKHLTIEDCVTGALSYLAPDNLKQLAWRPVSEELSYIEDNQLLTVPAKGDGTSVLISLASLNKLLALEDIAPFSTLPAYEWVSHNEILFAEANVLVWYDVAGRSIVRHLSPDEGSTNLDFSPGYSSVAFTLENNLYLYDAGGNRHEVSVHADRNLVSGQIVSREEFGISKGTFWDPSGSALAFYVKDESEVTDYPLVDVTERVAALHKIKYPMAGMKSEKLRVGIYRPADRSTVFLDTGEPDDHYLTNIAWGSDSKKIYVAEINRDQNHVSLNRYNAVTGAFEATLFEERDPKYIEPLNPIVFVPDQSGRFIWQSRKDGYNHLYLYDADGNQLKQLTSGEWEVLTFAGFSDDAKTAYFTATRDGVKNEMLYGVNLGNGRISPVTPDPGVHSVLLNPEEDLILDRYSSTAVPNTIQVRDVNGRLINTLLEADDPLEDYALTEVRDGILTAADGKTDLQYRLFLPAQMEEGRKYPVIVYVYNGPQIQLVTNSWVNDKEMWLQYMADKGYVGFILDGRGSENRGKEFEQVIFRSLGTHEMEDQLKGVDFLKSLDFVDPDRIGVYGRSYGGFMTTSLMTTYPDVFKTGVAEAPVIDWKYYEVMYTERYMDTPEANPEGYAAASVLNKVQNLKGDLLVIHGAMDSTVVWQHSMMLLRRCVETDILIDYFVYPTHEHHVTGIDKVHLMRKVTDYFDKNL